MEKLVFLVVALYFPNGLAHQGERHSKTEAHKEKVSENVLNNINQSYQKSVAPIFEKKCIDCHGDPEKLPWYYALPVAEGIMNDDMREAKKHLDMRSGFPFKGHGTPKEDLDAILEVTKKNEMPPFRYRIMHWSSNLTSDEREKIQAWVEQSKELLREKE